MSTIKAKTKVEATATIVSSSDTSNVIFIGDNVFVGIITPSDLRSVATLTILHSDSATGTFTPYKAADGTDWTITLATSSTLSINPLNVFGLLPFIKLKGNGNATGGDLVLTSLMAG